MCLSETTSISKTLQNRLNTTAHVLSLEGKKSERKACFITELLTKIYIKLNGLES